MVRHWVDNHFKLVGAFLVILAALNLLVSCALFASHSLMAAANATMAVILAGESSCLSNLNKHADWRSVGI
jgi:hypothetical protein